MAFMDSDALLVSVAILADGQALPAWRRPADRRAFVEGVPGQQWTMRVRNNMGFPVEVVAGVDGRSVHRDEPAGTPGSRGHLVPAFGFQDLKGWRLDDSDSGPFIFADPSASVAALAAGDTSNVGVIGILAYRERRSEPPQPEEPDEGPTMDMAPVAVASAGGSYSPFLRSKGASLGTGIGARASDPVSRVEFERDDSPPDRLVIGYGTRADLRAQGISFASGPLARRDPDPFPGMRSGATGYEKLTD